MSQSAQPLPPVPSSPIASAFQGRDTIRWVRGVLWRGKFLILAVLLLLLVPTILYLQQVTPLYTATAEVLIESSENNDTLLDRNNPYRQRLNEAAVMTESEVLTSTPLALRVIEKLGLDNDPEYNARLRKPSAFAGFMADALSLQWLPEEWRPAPSAPTVELSQDAQERMAQARIIQRFLSRVDVRASRRSYVITVAVSSENREKAARIANMLVEFYILDRLEVGFQETRRVTGWLSERLEGLRRDVAVAEAAVEQYRIANNLRRSSDRSGTINEQQLSEINSRLVLARSDLAQKQARLDQVRSLIRQRGSVETSIDVLQSQLIQRLREQEVALIREMSDATKTFGDRHPRLIALRADLNELRAKIASEVEKIGTSIANEVEVAAAGVRTLERELSLLRRTSDTAGEAEIRLRELERDAATSRELYQSFLARFKRDAEQDRIQRANARVLSPAEIPSAPSSPRSRLITFAVVLLGLGAGVALVFLLDHLDNAVRSTNEAEDITGLPVFAAVPAARRRGGPAELQVLKRPRSGLADAFRTLRTALTLSGTPDDKVIMVTSSVPEEGKSFVALSLARQYKRADGRVLLIDGDLHRPRLHKAINVDGARGMMQLLNGSATLEELIVHDTVGEIDFLPAGRLGSEKRKADEPVMELTAEALDRVMEMLRARYDRIILDTPPVLAVADTRVLAGVADRVLYLVRWNATPRQAVRTGVRLLRDARAQLAGIVLSRVDTRRHARYGYGDYGQYYGRYGGYYAD
ncbi:GumC family protein [Elstera cyanobacteriorum]|uniref:GumC family protein n=1 Tax=Elstera cyanobacteriorum TaxID=2022747 RepID=UPI002355CE23|nr:polysaccharide biosynthesis tyrosine autokinase [Elstera cyanobacteriorum]MCK6442450.1 polysaccharide biosynthesis tyrosine autokinase [Elstera cyanobacteriorum]